MWSKEIDNANRRRPYIFYATLIILLYFSGDSNEVKLPSRRKKRKFEDVEPEEISTISGGKVQVSIQELSRGPFTPGSL